MIHLVTGLPGHGKTLWTIWHYKQIAERDSRPIYYYNIKDLSLNWLTLENPQKWFECEPNSIIVIDEAQTVFRPAASGSSVPEFIAKLETHRHGGIDLVVITQMPMLLHKNVRMLVGKHSHVVRVMGLHRSRIHEWPECKDNPRAGSRKDSICVNWKYPKEVFTYYKSAEVHTHKAHIPARVIFFFTIPVLLVLLLWYSWHVLKPIYFPDQSALLGGVQGAPGASSSAPLSLAASMARADGKQGSQDKNQHLSKGEYLANAVPRVHDLPFSAPMYDDVTKPVDAPYPAACISMGDRCRCYSQQGTILDVSHDFCKQVVEHGFFVAWDTNKGRRDVPAGSSAPAAVPTASPSPVAGRVADADAVAWVPYSNPGNQTHSNIKKGS